MPSETVKQRAIDALQALPDDATIDDAIERLCLIAKFTFSRFATARRTCPGHCDESVARRVLVARKSPMATIKEHERVVLTKTIPVERPEAGDVGTFVHVCGDGLAYEIELTTPDG